MKLFKYTARAVPHGTVTSGHVAAETMAAAADQQPNAVTLELIGDVGVPAFNPMVVRPPGNDNGPTLHASPHGAYWSDSATAPALERANAAEADAAKGRGLAQAMYAEELGSCAHLEASHELEDWAVGADDEAV
jgi:hypothetical protein